MNIMKIFILLNAIVTLSVKAFSCDQGQCYCLDNRPNVNILYMNEVQILDFESIMRNLPNLYLTLLNMRYFKCEWLIEIPKKIHLHTNMCVSYPRAELTTGVIMTTHSEYQIKF